MPLASDVMKDSTYSFDVRGKGPYVCFNPVVHCIYQSFFVKKGIEKVLGFPNLRCTDIHHLF